MLTERLPVVGRPRASANGFPALTCRWHVAYQRIHTVDGMSGATLSNPVGASSLGLVDTGGPPGGPPPSGPRPGRRVRTGWRRRRRWVGLALLAVLIPATVSYIRALTYPGNASPLVRTVDWVRDHGGAPVVNLAENLYYRWHAPADAPPDPSALPFAPNGSSLSATVQPVPPIMSPSLPGEGVWAQASGIPGRPASVLTTFLRPDPAHGSVVAGIARFDQHAVTTRLIPGTREPSGLGWPEAGQVPAAARDSLLATFNSGFKMKDANGGFSADGRTPVALRDGAASAVIDRSGVVRIGAWGRDVGPGSDVVAVRQNLALIIDHGQIVPGLDVNGGGQWGSASNQLQYTWRSGLGVTATGDLIYVGGAGLTLSTLADALSRAGSVTAMELDIHNQMVDMFTYDHTTHLPGHLVGTPLLPTMPGPNDRYLQPDQRDFFAVTAR